MPELIPDAEKLVSDHLRDETGLRIVGKPPAQTDTPWVRVTQLDAAAEGGHRSDHLIRFYLQFDCYATNDGGQPEAVAIARELRQALVGMPEAGVTDAVVSGVDVRSSARIPDTDFEPARERFIITAFVWMHA